VETIYVQIASYRDSELVHTIRDCLTKAKYPERLRFGICWQKDEDDDSISEYLNDERFRIVNVPYTYSKGVCWARYITNTLYRKEDYTLQIDSHTRFIKDWDVVIIDSWKEFNDDLTILTGYPPSYFPNTDEETWVSIPNICNVFGFDDSGTTNIKPKNIEDVDKLGIRAVHIAAGFLFAKGDVIKKVPYDPSLYFHGEEHTMMLRFFTHGYNVYCLNKVIVYHYYVRENSSRHWTDNTDWTSINIISAERIQNIIGVLDTIDLGIYGLGTVRTLDEWKSYSGIDYKNKLLHSDTYNGIEPPLKDATNGWLEGYKKYIIKCSWNPDSIETTNIKFLSFMIFDEHQREIHREDIKPEDDKSLFNKESNERKFACLSQPSLRTKPKYFFIWPYSNMDMWVGDKPEYIEIDECEELINE
jgi:hypothetical protein